ncbi:MAG: hypothetical protein OER56_15265 [Hyphomicrobiales bacterium]|nr:hypothetical protein [Hyphomicrobiales bacterium]
MEAFSVLFDSSNWVMAREFMMTGKPPLITQILALNTVALIFWIVRRMRGASALRAQTANIVQGLLIAANCFVLLNGDFKFFDFSRVLNIFS